MAQNSLSPAFVRINYASPWGSHVMTVPSVPLITGAYAPTGYAFQLRGAALPVAVDDAVTDFVNVLKPLFYNGVNFSDAVVYSQPTPSDIPQPVASFPLDITGTATFGLIRKAVQMTFTWRADDFTLFKLVLLDGEMNTSDKATYPGYYGAAGTALDDYVTSDTTWLASRGGGRPTTFLQVSVTLNEKLRRSYNLT